MQKIFLLIITSVFFFSCKRAWTETDKSEFTGGCLKNAYSELGPGKARTYCSCLLKKMMDKYPNANDAPFARYDSTVVRLAKDCLKQQ